MNDSGDAPITDRCFQRNQTVCDSAFYQILDWISSVISTVRSHQRQYESALDFSSTKDDPDICWDEIVTSAMQRKHATTDQMISSFNGLQTLELTVDG